MTHSVSQEKQVKAAAASTGASPSGIILHSPVLYDFTVWLAMFGREQVFREKLLHCARLAAGDSVLDVGCGTGTLAIAARQRAGPNGSVYGVDASPEMIARARKKAKKSGAEIVFQQGLAENLPFADAQFDVVFSTMMFHHLPLKTRVAFVGETRRVLKPGGRVFVVDFEGIADQKRTFLSHFHRPHGHVALRDIIALLSKTGFEALDSGPIGVRDLQFVLASRSCS